MASLASDGTPHKGWKTKLKRAKHWRTVHGSEGPYRVSSARSHSPSASPQGRGQSRADDVLRAGDREQASARGSAASSRQTSPASRGRSLEKSEPQLLPVQSDKLKGKGRAESTDSASSYATSTASVRPSNDGQVY